MATFGTIKILCNYHQPNPRVPWRGSSLLDTFPFLTSHATWSTFTDVVENNLNLASDLVIGLAGGGLSVSSENHTPDSLSLSTSILDYLLSLVGPNKVFIPGSANHSPPSICLSVPLPVSFVQLFVLNVHQQSDQRLNMSQNSIFCSFEISSKYFAVTLVPTWILSVGTQKGVNSCHLTHSYCPSRSNQTIWKHNQHYHIMWRMINKCYPPNFPPQLQEMNFWALG